MKTNRSEIRQHVAAEVLELGEMLFDTVIEIAAQQPLEEKAVDTDLVEEMRAAADEYFTALRLLLEIKKP